MFRGSLTEQLAARLAHEIQSGAVQPGSRLQTEAELCRQHGVSRTVVREAISRLKSDGLVTSRQGAGIFVLKDGTDRTFRIRAQVESQKEIMSVMELRLAFDVEAAVLASRRRQARQLKAMRESLDTMAQVVATGEGSGVDSDLAFHRAIADATGNPLYRSFFQFLEPFVRRAITVARTRSQSRPGLPQQVYVEHEDLYRAIAEKDAAAAAVAARRNIEGAMRRLSS